MSQPGAYIAHQKLNLIKAEMGKLIVASWGRKDGCKLVKQWDDGQLLNVSRNSRLDNVLCEFYEKFWAAAASHFIPQNGEKMQEKFGNVTRQLLYVLHIKIANGRV